MPKHDAYSSFKAIHYPEKLAALKERRPFYPPHVQIIVSDLCNEDCVFCAYRMTGHTTSKLFGKPDKRGRVNPNRMISFVKLVEILDDCAAMGVRGIQYTGGGEPTIHPQFPAVMKRTKDLGIKYSVTTNGYKWSPGVRDGIRNAEWVRVSMDAGQPETYAAIRRVPPQAMRASLNNVKWLSENRQDRLVLGIGYVLTPDNWEECLIGAKLAKEHGADYIRFSAMFNPDDEAPFLPFYSAARDLIDKSKDIEDDTFRVYDRFGERVDDLRQKAPDYDLCAYQQFTTYIGGDLNVYRCCNTAYNEQGFLGSIAERRFKSLWDELCEKESLHRFDPRTCERCQFNGINRFLNYAVERDPVHVEFV